MSDDKSSQTKPAEAGASKAASNTTMTTPSSGMGGSTGEKSSKSAGEMYDDTKHAVADGAAGLTAKAKAQASSLAGKAQDMAESKLDEYKETATSRIDETAEHLRNAGREFGEDSYQAQAADYLASNLTRAADMVRNQSLSTVTDDLTRFARQNPALFLGGAALLGFAAARLMKASERRGYGGSYNGRHDRDDRFDRPPSGTGGTPYDRAGSQPYRGASAYGSGVDAGQGAGSAGGSLGTTSGSGMGGATGSGMGGAGTGMGGSSGMSGGTGSGGMGSGYTPGAGAGTGSTDADEGSRG